MEPAPEPVAEFAPEPTVMEPAPEPVAEVAPEPVAEVAPEPTVMEPAPEPVTEVGPEPALMEPAPEPVTEVAEVLLEPEVEPAPEPVTEVAPEPVEPVAQVGSDARPWQEGALARPSAEHLQIWSAQPELSDSGIPAGPYRELAYALAQGGHLREAVLAMGRALVLEPHIGAGWHAQLLGDWVELLQAQEQAAAALSVCQTWRELYPDDARAAALLQELTPEPPAVVEEEIDCENLDQALQALRMHPGNETLIRRTLELGSGHEDELMNLFRTLTRDHSDEPLHFRNFARVYLKLNKPILAVVQYQKFLVVRPTPDGYRELASAYTLLNREKNAAEALKKAEELAGCS
jgi:tetratricopeptide (TPR) repeat protein